MAASADELARPYGWEVVVDATGNARAIQDGLERVGPAGTYLQFGVADDATRVTIDPYRIYNKEITITGAMAVLHSYERAAELFAAGVLDPRIVHHRPAAAPGLRGRHRTVQFWCRPQNASVALARGRGQGARSASGRQPA